MRVSKTTIPLFYPSLGYTDTSAPLVGFQFKSPGMDDKKFTTFAMSLGCRRIHNLDVEGVPLLIRQGWIDRRQDVAIMFGLVRIHDPDRAGTLAHQVHGCWAADWLVEILPSCISHNRSRLTPSTAA